MTRVQNYLSVAVPSLNHADEIAVRLHGELVLYKVISENGIAYQHEEIARVALNNIQIYEGGRNQSVVLDGYKTVTKTPKETFLTGITYRKTSGAAPSTVRTAVPDTYLEPGDTVFAGNQELIASAITIAVGPRSSQMDVEA